MVALQIVLALVMLVKKIFSRPHTHCNIPLHMKGKCHLMSFLPCRCHKASIFSAEMKAELEKAKKEADAAKKVTCVFQGPGSCP